MKWFKYLILIAVAGFVLRNCCHTYVTHLSAEDTEWIKPYENKDKFIFTSNNGEDDTLYIVQTIRKNKFFPFYISTAGKIDTLRAWCRIDGVIKKRSGSKDFYFSISKDKDGFEPVISYKMGENVGVSGGNIPLVQRDTNLNTVKINNNIYTDCYIGNDIKYIGKESDYKANKLRRIIFSKECGLLYYEFENGDYFRKKDL